MLQGNSPGLHVGCFGPGLSGKTTLLKELSRSYWKDHGIPSIVIDPHREYWGPQAWVTDDMDRFLWMVYNTKSHAIFVEESSQTIDRDKDLTVLFTAIRHRGHKIHISGHTGMALLPVQRQQLQTVYLFRQPRSACRVWAEQLCDRNVLQAETLEQYEFLWCRLYKPVVKTRLQIV